jgi:hypothetical protein
MKKKLVVIALGNRNAGKSRTWYELFGRVIRSGWKTLQINNEEIRSFVKNSSFEETGKEITENVFVRNASFDEYGDDVEDYFGPDDLYDLIFCSVQYTEKGLRTIQYFKDNGYTIYIQWLNPGYHDRDDAKHNDVLGFEKAFGSHGQFHTVSGKEKIRRVQAIKEFVVKWILSVRKNTTD